MRNRRILKTIVAVGTAFSLVFLSGSFMASAGTKEIVIDGRNMWISTSVSQTGATASTYSGLGQAKTTVDATYVCINRNPASEDYNKTKTMYRNGSGNMGSSVSFSAPAGYSSVRVSASHTISYDTTYYSDSTAEDYHY